ncbi:hypothetical protein SeMB42_g06587 [Synchytrium endobioticum]|uniref:Translation initiation factor IF-2, mitochondrial n=1 Tax=Synchytrium endobioticum TaxID=286115 RepID=A0A507CPW9_9FUNG|nr:hypothetical protein SeMB42_g06587 [Synchytrium endobioticum]TPX41182.1 hypothetical protein SeLEV6574_g06219 [Synchytrium endobioticum]
MRAIASSRSSTSISAYYYTCLQCQLHRISRRHFHSSDIPLSEFFQQSTPSGDALSRLRSLPKPKKPPSPSQPPKSTNPHASSPQAHRTSDTKNTQRTNISNRGVPHAVHLQGGSLGSHDMTKIATPIEPTPVPVTEIVALPEAVIDLEIAAPESLDDDSYLGPRKDKKSPKAKPAIETKKSKRENPQVDVRELSEEEYAAIEEKRRRKAERKAAEDSAALEPKSVVLPEGITVANLSQLLNVRLSKLTATMRKMGMKTEAVADHVLTSEAASNIVLEYNLIPVVPELPDFDLQPRPAPESWSHFPLRPPVVTIMGHVDHGKTTLLDSLRKTSVAAHEAGGITQHIGAFSVTLPSGKQITFQDTPGHAAFSSMRARGAQITDIVILVVAADDGVMPQTVEAIQHSLAARVPIIVAINKCDKPDVNTRKVKQDLLRHGITIEEYGGEIPAIEISGLTGKGLDDLEETIVTVAEVMDIRGDPSGLVEGAIIEAKMSKGAGNVATVLVKRGTLSAGSILVAGKTWCKVRLLQTELGPIAEAGPSIPVEVHGWKDVPEAGDIVLETPDESIAQNVVRARKLKEERTNTLQVIEDINMKRADHRRLRDDADAMGKDEKVVDSKKKEVPKFPVILRADVHGSLEAIESAIMGLPNHEVAVTMVGSAVGPPNDSDVDLAATTGAHIITFNVPVTSQINAKAKLSNVPLHSHNIIYRLLDDLKEKLSELLPPVITRDVVGEAEVLQVFDINIGNKKGKSIEKIAGCRVLSGKVSIKDRIRIIRGGSDGEILYDDGSLKTFKHVKKEITEAGKGMECGMAFDGFGIFQPGDLIQAYVVRETKRKFT